jgi:riboflavin synthase
MFTGLIEHLGEVAGARARGGVTRFAFRSTFPADDLRDGESIAVDGVCLTVARRRGEIFEADAVPETLSRSTLGALRPGDRVHLERALRPSDRLGGHLVQGHVDAVASVLRLARRSGDVRLEVALPADLRGFVAEKGSIALHGVSLTVAGVGARSFTVALIPETLSRTKLGASRPGDPLNVEVDLLARYLDALMRARSPRLRGARLRSRPR